MRIEATLNGPRLLVRDYRAADRPFVEDLWFDPEVNRYLSDPAREYADAEYLADLAAMEDNPDGCYLIIERRADARPVGTCCAFPEDEAVWDIGYAVARSCWRRGYATEALGLLLAWIAARNGRAVTAEVASENAASCALLEHFGFRVARTASFRKRRMPVEFPSRIYRLDL